MELIDSGQEFSITNLSMGYLMRNKNSNLRNDYSYSMGDHMQNSETPYVPAASFFFHNFQKISKAEFPFFGSNNFRKKFENYTRYVNTKEHSVVGDEMDHWNQMSPVYSDFLSSPKEYSYVSNSIASYIIGGFVGSKSQMNNEKHKLSFDLGEVILKILHDCRYEKGLDKFRDERKCEISKMGRKSKYASKELNETFEKNCDFVLWKNLIDKSQRIGNNQWHNSDFEYCNSFNEETAIEGNNLEIINDSQPMPVQKMKSEGEPIIAENKDNSDIKELCCTSLLDETHCGDQVLNNDCYSKKLKAIDAISVEKSLCCHTSNVELENKDKDNGSDLLNKSMISRFSSAAARRRRYSECSVESTDSESFIVFDDRSIDSSYEELHSPIPQECENDECDFLDEEDECISNDDESSFWIRSSDEFEAVEDKEIAEANARWSEFYSDTVLENGSVDGCDKKVRFNEKIKVHKIIAWDYAYRAARQGPWEQMARDRDRFRERIFRLNAIVAPILQQHHRKIIFEKLYV